MHMTRPVYRVGARLAASVLALSLFSCNLGPPALPPDDTMLLPNFFGNDENALTTVNFGLAKSSVGLVTVALHLALFWPRAFFAGNLQQDPVRDGDDWVWARTYPLWGFETELRVTDTGDQVQVRYLVTGTHNGQQLEGYEWFSGKFTEGNGQWVLNDPAQDGPVLTIDWERVSDTDKTLTFTNVTEGADGLGDTVIYDLDGTTASMSLHDARDDQGQPADFRVEWDTEEGSGRIDAADGQSYCWDSFAGGQGDIDCP